MTARPKSYAEAFLTYFDVCFATDETMKEDVGRIRYRVYCEEFGYEDKSAFPSGIELDDFDHQSQHCLVIHKASATPAGCVRVVRGNGNNLLPFEKFCSDSLDKDFFEQNQMPRESMSEVSRLAVDGLFRRRAGEQATRYGGVHISDLSQQEQRTFPLIAVSCFLAATALTDLMDCNNAFAMMEPFLPRMLARSGIHFTKVGQDIDYHGLRAPYFVTTQAAVDNMAPELRELYEAIYSRVKVDFREV
jgi:N-acyl amino acid synthase of PEP-CTERM/exosortase system